MPACTRKSLSALALSALALTATLAPGRLQAQEPEITVEDSQPLMTLEESGGSRRTSRLMVALNTPITGEILTELGTYGQVRGWIERYRVVAMTARRGERAALRALPFVDIVENDRKRFLTDVGTWDRDMLDITDVEETDVVGDPDAREVTQTGAGVHVAVIDTGLVANWRDLLVESRVDTSLALAFSGGGVTTNEFNISNPTDKWEGDTNSHGTAVASHVIGFKVGALVVDGAAPGARVIPLKVFPNGEAETFASRIIAAIAYVTDLVEGGVIGRTVINLSLGGPAPSVLEERAINDAIRTGIIVVASAGNQGEAGMGWPGAFPQVISAGAVGWTRQLQPGTAETLNLRFWWTQDVNFDPDRGSGPAEQTEAFVPGFSGRALLQRHQELDVLAPGANTVAPGLHGPRTGLFFWSGTSFSSPLTAGVAALILEKNPALSQAQVESILKSTALPVPPVDGRSGVLTFAGEVSFAWDDDCSGLACDAVGAGLLQADDALDATPRAGNR
jgi:subtilisin family serine protease